MRAIPTDMITGVKHKQRDGVATIVKYYNTNKVVVSFENGYGTSVQAGHLRKGTIKNRLLPTVFGIGFMGVGVHKSCSGKGGIHSKIYQDWINMIGRCYNPERLELYPSYSGCTVCDKWHDFQVFGDWYVDNYPADDGDYHLDKDILSYGAKVYSPETCVFVSPFENYQKAHAKKAKLKSPSGEIIEVYNISKFCRDNNLSQPCINDITIGKKDNYKGWSSADE